MAGPTLLALSIGGIFHPIARFPFLFIVPTAIVCSIHFSDWAWRWKKSITSSYLYSSYHPPPFPYSTNVPPPSSVNLINLIRVTVLTAWFSWNVTQKHLQSLGPICHIYSQVEHILCISISTTTFTLSFLLFSLMVNWKQVTIFVTLAYKYRAFPSETVLFSTVFCIPIYPVPSSHQVQINILPMSRSNGDHQLSEWWTVSVQGLNRWHPHIMINLGLLLTFFYGLFMTVKRNCLLFKVTR